MKSQIHPHFLFNTLNNLYRLVMDNEQAGEVVLKLADLLRFTLYESQTDAIPIKSVVEFLQNYLSLEKIRLKESLTLEYDFSQINNIENPIAPLLFINFIENAFKHGSKSSNDAFRVQIKLAETKNIVSFEISNSKPKKTILSDQVSGNGINNIKKRLNFLYPDRYKLEIIETPNLYKVNLNIQLV